MRPSTIRQGPAERGRPGRGFTLAEILVCAALLAIGFAALVTAFGYDTRVAQFSEEATYGVFLADEIRDKTLQMAFADVLNLDGVVYNPAILSNGSAQDLAKWSQRITVAPVLESDLNHTVGQSGAHAARLTVEVRANNKPVLTETYYMLNRSDVPYTDVGG
jgi:prepilin-type N-terminal cleavage/methylation domain-containing protein